MSQASIDSAHPSRAVVGQIANLFLVAVVAVCLLVIFSDPVELMVARWGTEEYNHGFMIPFVAFYLFWLRARELNERQPVGSWLGIVFLVLGLGLQLLGAMSAVYEIAQYGFVVCIWGMVIAAAGLRGLRILWVPLVYLLFMVPMATFVERQLTAGLQLLSSQIGVAVIRSAGLSVFLEGNVIDLGSYQLQVAEACSGMRYLFPLMSFGFLCAVLMRGRWWQRTILFVSTVPITILMNSVRIGIIGILVNYYGIEQAEGFLHDFEGWVVFMACVLILFAQIWIFARMEKQKFLQIFGLDIPALPDLLRLNAGARPNMPVLTGTVILIVAGVFSLTVTRPASLIPVHAPLSTFPMQIGEWQGRDQAVDQRALDELKLSDYTSSAFVRPVDPMPIGLWIAYYDQQVQGASTHSPRSCLPGGGWRIETLEEYAVPGVLADGGAQRVNRAVIAMGDQRQLVYYWFAQRGRTVTNEFAVKWYIFWDGLTRNRTDGALVRMTTYVGDVDQLPAADARLQAFMRDIDPKLSYFLPGELVPFKSTSSALDTP
jgi:exosortase D (VPLPA-CTERM-specific)